MHGDLPIDGAVNASSAKVGRYTGQPQASLEIEVIK